MINQVEYMIPQPPVPPLADNKNKKEVLYFDGPIERAKDIKEKLKYNHSCYLFYQIPWPDRMGYDIARDPQGAEYYLVANCDILGKRDRIDADLIFEKYDMIYLSNFEKTLD